MKLRNFTSALLNKYLPQRLVGYIAARGVIKRYRKGVTIEKEMIILYQLLNPGDKAIDIGANIGEYTLQLAKLVGSAGHVYAFEPIPRNFNKLNSLVEIAKLSNVDIYQVAMGENPGTSSMFVKWELGMLHVNSSHILSDSSKTDKGIKVDINVDILDRSFAECDFIRLIKCDAEGMELPILKGGERLIRRCHPILIVEVSDLCERYGFKKTDLVLCLDQLGYKPLCLEKDGMGWHLRLIKVQELMRLGDCNCIFTQNTDVQNLIDTVSSFTPL